MKKKLQGSQDDRRGQICCQSIQFFTDFRLSGNWL